MARGDCGDRPRHRPGGAERAPPTCSRVCIWIGAIAMIGASASEPERLNELRLRAPRSEFHGEFSLILRDTEGGSSSSNSGMATPSDIKGPFHLPPETVPDSFPRRESACVAQARAACKSGGVCQNHAYDDGLPLKLNVTVTSTDRGRRLSGALVDIWQADPNGVYWKDDEHWDGRRRLDEDDDEAHRFNCRAHGVADAEGVVSFSTYLPGHYVAGSAWRPRHIHLRASSDGHDAVVTQIYFGGDPFLGPKDTACVSCKSDNEMLVVQLELHNGTDAAEFSLADLSSAASSPSSSSSSPSPSPSSVVIATTGIAGVALMPSPSDSIPSKPVSGEKGLSNRINSKEMADTSDAGRGRPGAAYWAAVFLGVRLCSWGAFTTRVS